MEIVGNDEFEAAGLDDWRKLAQRLHARFWASGSLAAADAVAAILAETGRYADHLDLRLIGQMIDIAVCTRHDGRWVTEQDVDLAGKISVLTRELGLTPEPAAVTQLELALDTARKEVIGPFWSTLLTGSPDNAIHGSVFDPTDRVPSLWFQATDDHEVPRQRWHFDLWLAPEAAAERIAAAIAAGGTLVDDSAAPLCTVLADPDGNRVCVCTSAGRD